MPIEIEKAVANPAHGLSTGGDAIFVNNATAVNSDETVAIVGRDNAKTPVNYATVARFDVSDIPTGTGIVVEDAMIEVLPNSTESGAFTMVIDVLSPDSRLNDVQLRLPPYGLEVVPSKLLLGVSTVWANQVVSSDFRLTMNANGKYGLGNWAQAFESNHTGQCAASYWYGMYRSGSLGASAKVRGKLWNATGGAGSWVKGSEITNGGSTEHDADTRITTTPGEIVHLDFALDGGGFAQVESGETYIAEASFTGLSGSGTTFMDCDSTPPETDDNQVMVAYDSTHPIHGFEGRAQWLNGVDIAGASTEGSSDSFSTGFNFSSGVKFSFGDSPNGIYTINKSLTNFRANLQSALRARTSSDQMIGVTMRDFTGTTNNRTRHFHSSASSTPTKGSLKGMVLTMSISGTGEYLRRYEHVPDTNVLLRR